MKKLILTTIMVLASIWAFSQATPVAAFRVVNATTAFGVNIPTGSLVYDVATDNYYRATTGVISTATLTTASGSFTVFAAGAGDVTSSGGTANEVAYFNATGKNIEGDPDMTFDGDKFTVKQLYISTPTAGIADYDKFLVLDVTGTEVKTRSGAEVLADIGAEGAFSKGDVTEATSSILTFTGETGRLVGSGDLTIQVDGTLAEHNATISDATLYEWEEDQAGTTIHGNNIENVDPGLATGFLKTTTTTGALSSVSSISLTADISGVLPVANGGTNSSTALNNDFVMVSSGNAVVESATVTTTELGLLNGETALHKFYSETFEETTTGASGTAHSLTNDPVAETRITVSLNGYELKDDQYTTVFGGSPTVQVTIQVYQYDRVTVTYSYN